MAKEQDDWKTEEPYDSDFVFTTATDSKGHGEHVHSRVPHSILGRIAAVVQSPNTSYSTTSDLIRDAIYHRLFYWQDKLNDGETYNVLARLRIMQSVLDEQETIKAFNDNLRKIRDVSDYYRRENAKAEARKLAAELQEIAGSIHGKFWRDRCLKMLSEEFEWLKTKEVK